MHRLKEAMLLLIANDGPLAPEWLDHALGGEWAGHRECHIGGDFLLAYKIDDTGKYSGIVFVRAGSHADFLSNGGKVWVIVVFLRVVEADLAARK